MIINRDSVIGGLTVVQVKQYSRVIGVSHVRELVGAMDEKRAGRGILVTTSWFTSGCWTKATDNGQNRTHRRSPTVCADPSVPRQGGAHQRAGETRRPTNYDWLYSDQSAAEHVAEPNTRQVVRQTDTYTPRS